MLVLRSRREPLTVPDGHAPARVARLIARTLATDGKLLGAAFVAGQAAARAAVPFHDHEDF